MLKSRIFQPPVVTFAANARQLLDRDKFTRFVLEEALNFNIESVRVAHCGGRTVMAFPMTVAQQSTNVFGTLHGGALMSLLDCCTTLHLAYTHSGEFGHPSVDLSMGFVASAQQGDQLVAITRMDHSSASLVHMSMEVLLDHGLEVPEDALFDEWLRKYRIVAQGKHIKRIAPVSS